MSAEGAPVDRRRSDRRAVDVRLAELPVPELRKAIVTGALLLAIVALFAYMVADVLVAAIAGIVVGAYLVPFDAWLHRRLRHRALSAIITILLVTLPLIAILIYSWVEISGATEYLAANSRAVAERLTLALRRIPFVGRIAVEDDLSRFVAAMANRSGRVLDDLQEAVDVVVISIAVFLFTIFYVLVDRERVGRYLRLRLPARYRDLADRVSGNVRAVVYGALYATFLTQLIKAAIILTMNLVWDVPLAVVLAIAAFFIGFFPIVGSWAVYAPVALYLIVFRDETAGGILMLSIGFFVNTLFLSMYVRPKIAAEKSHVLNFYWMFIALVTGVYAFGLVGIIIGPVLIGILKATFESVTGGPVSVLRDGGSAAEGRPSAA